MFRGFNKPIGGGGGGSGGGSGGNRPTWPRCQSCGNCHNPAFKCWPVCSICARVHKPGFCPVLMQQQQQLQQLQQQQIVPSVTPGYNLEQQQPLVQQPQQPVWQQQQLQQSYTGPAQPTTPSLESISQAGSQLGHATALLQSEIERLWREQEKIKRETEKMKKEMQKMKKGWQKKTARLWRELKDEQEISRLMREDIASQEELLDALEQHVALEMGAEAKSQKRPREEEPLKTEGSVSGSDAAVEQNPHKKRKRSHPDHNEGEKGGSEDGQAGGNGLFGEGALAGWSSTDVDLATTAAAPAAATTNVAGQPTSTQQAEQEQHAPEAAADSAMPNDEDKIDWDDDLDNIY